MSVKKKNDEDADPFWSRILIVTVIVVWLALVGGNWIGHYMVKAGIFAQKSSADGGEFKIMPPSKPKPWKKPVKVITPTEPPVKDYDEPVIVRESDKPTDKPTAKPPKPSPEPVATGKPEVKPSPKPKPSPSPRPKPSPSPRPKPSPSPRPKPSPSPRPKPSPSPSPAPKPSPSPTKAAASDETGSFSLQCGSFDKNENALELVAKLKAKGYSATIAKVGSNYKVYIGNYNKRSKADEMKEKLKKDNFDAFTVSNQ